MSPLRSALAIAGHDLRLELRRPAALTGMLVFAVGATVAEHLALAGSGTPTQQTATGALWLVLLFAALLGIGSQLAAERDERSFDALLMAPVGRATIYVGKAIAAAVVVVCVHVVLVPIFAAAFRAPDGAGGWLRLACVVVLADVGLAVVGVLVTALTFGARGRELLATVAFLPLAVPLVIAGVAGTTRCFGGASGPDLGLLLGFLVVYDAVFLAVGIAAFPEVVIP